jgi:phospholipase/carboxylesterase
VIPRDLLERTWAYLHGDAGSTTTGVRDPGGHGISADVVTELHRWLTDMIVEREVTS